MTPWTERPTHVRWLEAQALGLLEFGRRTVPDDRGGRWLTDEGAVDRGLRHHPTDRGEDQNGQRDHHGTRCCSGC